MRDRLLAEDVLARLRCLDDEVRMRIGGGANQDSLNFRIRQDLFAGVVYRGNSAAAASACAASQLTSAIAVGLRANGYQCFGMDFPDSAGAMIPTFSCLLSKVLAEVI
jgi:hypothetical protein